MNDQKLQVKKDHIVTGKLGEKLALRYMLQKGYGFITKNYYGRWCELDLIMKKGQKIVFVEVKTRRTDYFGSGIEAFDLKKRKKLIRAIHKFMECNPLIKMSIQHWQLDLIDVHFSSNHKAIIKHFQNVLEEF